MKVMNMKPPEILSMIEEATGTSMYESKKESAQRMMEKKENKLTQINQVINLCRNIFLIAKLGRSTLHVTPNRAIVLGVENFASQIL